MLPLAVRDDPRLKFADVLTFTHLAEVQNGGHATISLAALAKRLGRRRSTISESITALVNAGHVTRDDGRDGRVGAYALTNPIFRTGTRPENRTTRSRKLDGTHPENRTHTKLVSPTLLSLHAARESTQHDAFRDELTPLLARCGYPSADAASAAANLSRHFKSQPKREILTASLKRAAEDASIKNPIAFARAMVKAGTAPEPTPARAVNDLPRFANDRGADFYDAVQAKVIAV